MPLLKMLHRKYLFKFIGVWISFKAEHRSRLGFSESLDIAWEPGFANKAGSFVLARSM
jgi:hypothetical protein